jgi:hypothetical protein
MQSNNFPENTPENIRRWEEGGKNDLDIPVTVILK